MQEIKNCPKCGHTVSRGAPLYLQLESLKAENDRLREGLKTAHDLARRIDGDMAKLEANALKRVEQLDKELQEARDLLAAYGEETGE
jgi:hypothetical protein